MRTLYLSSRELFLDVQVESDQAERYFDRLGVFVRHLYRERVHHVLMNKRRIAVCQRVKAQFMEDVWF
jgi:hypothetical protein